MKRINLYLLAIAVILGCLTSICITAIAAEPEESSSESEDVNNTWPLAYCTEEEKDYVYEMLTDDDFYLNYYMNKFEYHFDKESITPSCRIDLLDYNETKEVKIIPGHAYNGYGEKGGRIYYVKVMNKNNDCIGWTSVHYVTSIDGMLSGNNMIIAHNELSRTYSLDYEVHAKQIQELMGTEDLIPRENVWLVEISHRAVFAAYFFGYFVDYQGEQQLISVPQYENADFISGENFQPDTLVPIERLQDYADHLIKAKEDAKNAPPFDVRGDGATGTNSELESEKNIETVTAPNEESGAESSESPTGQKSEEPKSKASLWIVISVGATLLVGLLIAFLAVRSKRRRISNE